MKQRGSLAVEFAILVPALVLLFGLIIGGARTWLARSGVQHMAGAAARAASLERSADAAQQMADNLAAQQAAASGIRCRPLSVQLDTQALTQPAGTPGRITARVDCDVPMGDITVPGWPGTVMVSATATAVVDTYRGRTP